jgi:aryl carrier-like protein
MKKEPRMSETEPDETAQGIAVVGMAGRFPGAPSAAAFWRNLRDGVESISFFSEEELLAAGVDPAVREAVVTVREEMSGERRLVGYVVPVEAAPANAELRAFLRETLPEYMVPWTFVALDAMPVTANGKLDRAALPAPQRRATSAAVAPRNALEREIAAAWRDVLGVGAIGVEDNFFEVGGSSLLLGKLQARLRRSLERDVSFVDLFRHPTIESLARSLAEAPAPEALGEQARARTDTRRERMSQIQKRRKR